MQGTKKGLRVTEGVGSRGPTPGPETMLFYWHPLRPQSRKPDPAFYRKLKDLGNELEVSWSPVHERWLVWMRTPRIRHRLCPGWMLLFPVQDQDGNYLPLDERTLARLAHASVFAHGSAKEYFNRVVAEQERDAERERKASDAERDAIADSFFQHQQIQVGYGKSSGSKFTTYLS